jgi:hypothetical protein
MYSEELRVDDTEGLSRPGSVDGLLRAAEAERRRNDRIIGCKCDKISAKFEHGYTDCV